MTVSLLKFFIYYDDDDEKEFMYYRKDNPQMEIRVHKKKKFKFSFSVSFFFFPLLLLLCPFPYFFLSSFYLLPIMDNNQTKEDNSILNEVNLTAVRENLEDVKDTLSPGDKKAAAEKKSEVVLESLPNLKADASMANDQGTNDSKTLAAAIANADATKAATTTAGTTSAPVKKSATPGSFEAKAGWNAFSKLPNPGDEAAIEGLNSALGLDTLISMYKGARTATASEVNHEDLVSQFLKEAYYGEWYHNTAVILFTVVFTWLLTRFGGGLMACLVVGAFLATYYQTSIRRLRRNIRDDISRELSINRLETETESADWINHFMSRFWLIYEPVLSAQIIGIADAILVDSTPAFLDSIRLTSFTLGTKAPRIEGIKTLTKTEPNVVVKYLYLRFV